MNETSKSRPRRRLPKLEAFLERLGVRSCDSDFEELGKFLGKEPLEPERGSSVPSVRWQDQVIEETIERHATLLDVGCGEGDLLVRVAESRQARVQGIELDQELVIRCIERGIPVYHGDLEKSIRNFQDGSFDYVVMEETLQTLKHPLVVLRELLRVGRRTFVSFPNFAHWNVRLAFSLGGRMPKTGALPYSWYDTPNIHLCSINDFLDWTATDHVQIERAWVYAGGKVLDYRPEHNLIAEQAMFLVRKQDGAKRNAERQ
jgi:methionine biosynthesis protein MetW